MAGIQVHTSAPINANIDPASEDSQHVERTGLPSTQYSTRYTPSNHDMQQSSAGMAYAAVEPPTRTVAAPPPLPPAARHPPPPQPGQTPVAATQLPDSAPATANLPSLPMGTPFSGQSTGPPVQQDLSHPPGYQQQTTSFQDRPVYEDSNSNSQLPSSISRAAGSLLDTGMSNESQSEQSPIWDTAMSWAKAAGNKLSTTEAQVWKMVNGEK